MTATRLPVARLPKVSTTWVATVFSSSGSLTGAVAIAMGVLGIFSFRMSSSTLSWVSRQVKMAVRTRGSSTS